MKPANVITFRNRRNSKTPMATVLRTEWPSSAPIVDHLDELRSANLVIASLHAAIKPHTTRQKERSAYRMSCAYLGVDHE